MIAAAENHYYHKDLRKFAEYFYEKPASFEFFRKIFKFSLMIFRKLTKPIIKQNKNLQNLLFRKNMGRSFEGKSYLLDVISKLRSHKPASFFSNFQKGLGIIKFDALYNFNQHSMQQFFGQMELFTPKLTGL